jgi:hypothetical protein
VDKRRGFNSIALEYLSLLFFLGVKLSIRDFFYRKNLKKGNSIKESLGTVPTIRLPSLLIVIASVLVNC